MTKVRILITGAAGFVGAHLSDFFLKEGFDCLCIDSMNDYYSPDLKESRIHAFNLGSVFQKIDLTSYDQVALIFSGFKPEIVIHLAAQPGVRYARKNPNSYIQNNIIAFENVLENVKRFETKRFLYASSSSVYGDSAPIPFQETQRGGLVRNLYALTKRFNEDRVATEDGLQSTAMRFFSVYGNWGRPDMAYFRVMGSALDLWQFNQLGDGEQLRDYTHVSDVVKVIGALVQKEEIPKVINIGGGQPVSLNYMRTFVEKAVGRDSNLKVTPKDESEALLTQASTSLLEALDLPIPQVKFDEGMKEFCEWAISVPREKYSTWLDSSK